MMKGLGLGLLPTGSNRKNVCQQSRAVRSRLKMVYGSHSREKWSAETKPKQVDVLKM